MLTGIPAGAPVGQTRAAVHLEKVKPSVAQGCAVILSFSAAAVTR